LGDIPTSILKSKGGVPLLENAVCTDTAVLAILSKSYPVLLPVKIPFTLQRTFYKEISVWKRKRRSKAPSLMLVQLISFSLYRVSRSPRQSGASNLRERGAATDAEIASLSTS
jgi:hypothetical protein